MLEQLHHMCLHGIMQQLIEEEKKLLLLCLLLVWLLLTAVGVVVLGFDLGPWLLGGLTLCPRSLSHGLHSGLCFHTRK